MGNRWNHNLDLVKESRVPQASGNTARYIGGKSLRPEATIMDKFLDNESVGSELTGRESNRRGRNKWALGLLGVVLFVGGWLRIGGAERVGIRFEDEALYFADARLWHRSAKLAMDPLAIAAVATGSKEVLRSRIEQADIRFQDRDRKPSQGYTFLSALMMFVVGEGAVALVTLNALAGTLSILLIYFIGASLCGRSVGLIAAFVLALSPYHLLYSRGALPDSTAIMFTLLGAWFWIRAGQLEDRCRLFVIGAGLSFGYAITCHYRSGYLICVLGLVEGVRYLVGSSPFALDRIKRFLSRWVLFACMVLVPAVSIELVFRVGQLLAWMCGGDLPLRTYFESAYDHAVLEHAVGASAGGGSFWGLNLVALKAFGVYLNHLQGFPACALCFLGMIAFIVRRGIGILPVAVIFVTIALLVSQPYVVARGFSFAVPFFAVCTAGGIVLLSTWAARRRTTALAAVSLSLVALALIPTLKSTATIFGRSSQLGDACAFLSASDAGQAVAAEDPLKYEAFNKGPVRLVEGRRYRASGTPLEMLEKMRLDGVRWVIADPQRWHYRDAKFAARDGVFHWWQEMEEVLRERATLVFEAAHVAGDPWEFLAEGPGLIYLDEMSRRGDGAIRIYELSPISG